MTINFALIVLLFTIVVSIIFLALYARKNLDYSKRAVIAMADQYALISKMQAALRSRYATNAIAENSEIIYQDLLQHVIPIMRAADVSPRNSDEHPLWRALGGLMDEYGKNPFALEQLRRAIKLDGNVTRATDAFLIQAETLLKRLNDLDGNNLLGTAFADGLLGQTMTLLAQAKQLAKNS